MKHDVWIAIAALTVICFVIKAAGPVALGGRDLPQLGGPADRADARRRCCRRSWWCRRSRDGKELVLDARAAGLGRRDGRAVRCGRACSSCCSSAALTAAGLRALGVG